MLLRLHILEAEESSSGGRTQLVNKDKEEKEKGPEPSSLCTRESRNMQKPLKETEKSIHLILKIHNFTSLLNNNLFPIQLHLVNFLSSSECKECLFYFILCCLDFGLMLSQSQG